MAGAIVSRGVDAGIDGFTRFSLGSTTSSKTFEPRCIGRIDLTGSEATHASALSAGLSRVVDLCDRLPRDVRKGQQWIFRGLRGPIEGALIRHAGCPSDLEEATRLLDALVGALDRVEANRTFREASVEFDLLPLEWLVVWLGRDEPSPEVRVAMGIASLLDEPLLMHRWGVRRAKGSPTRYRFTKERQPRCVWAIGPLASNLSRVLQRRLIDAGNEAHGPQTLPTKAAVNVCRDDVSLWLAGELDERELSRWIDRLSLFDWRSVPETVREMLTYTESKRPVDGALAFWGLFRPLLDRRQLFVAGKPLFEERADPRTVAAGRSLVARMGIPDLKGAVELAASRYHMSGRPLGSVGAAFTFEEPLRLVSALLFQPFLGELVEVTPRWLRPSRTEGGL
jgi:CRISPR-associated protein Csx17